LPVDESLFAGDVPDMFPLEFDLSLLPAWSLRAQLKAAILPFEKIIHRYMGIRLVLKAVDYGVNNKNASLDDLHFIIRETKKIFDAYEAYVDRLKRVRLSLKRHVEMFTKNGKEIKLDLDRLNNNCEDCRLYRSYGMQMTLKEYRSVENEMDASFNNSSDMLKQAVEYMITMFKQCPELYTRALEEADQTEYSTDEESDF
jgi:hypothetical protein